RQNDRIHLVDLRLNARDIRRDIGYSQRRIDLADYFSASGLKILLEGVGGIVPRHVVRRNDNHILVSELFRRQPATTGAILNSSSRTEHVRTRLILREILRYRPPDNRWYFLLIDVVTNRQCFI